jgi:hypothetical protein
VNGPIDPVDLIAQLHNVRVDVRSNQIHPSEKGCKVQGLVRYQVATLSRDRGFDVQDVVEATLR